MCRLNEQQISDISARLKADQICYSHLFEDLLDHICCDIEDKIEHGIDYNSAYKSVFEKIGLCGLKEIQEATIFYVKLNLIVMKKFMNVMAIAGTILLALTLVFKTMHWPGGSMLMFLGFLVIFLGFFPIGLLNLKKELSLDFLSRKFFMYLIGFITFVETGAALMFAAMQWPGTKYLTIISWALMLFLFFPMLFIQVLKNEKNRIINLGLVIFAFIFIIINIVGSYNKQVSPYNTVSYTLITQELNYYKTAIEDEYILMRKENPRVIDTLSQLVNALESVEQIVNKYQEGILNGETDVYVVSQKFMHKSNIDPWNDNSFRELKTAINNYSVVAMKFSNENKTLKHLIENKLGTGPQTDKLFGNSCMSWEMRTFMSPGTPVGIYTNLQHILKDTYMIKYEVVRNLSKRLAPEL